MRNAGLAAAAIPGAPGALAAAESSQGVIDSTKISIVKVEPLLVA